jgi:hypothetical protein
LLTYAVCPAFSLSRSPSRSINAVRRAGRGSGKSEGLNALRTGIDQCRTELFGRNLIQFCFDSSSDFVHSRGGYGFLHADSFTEIKGVYPEKYLQK